MTNWPYLAQFVFFPRGTTEVNTKRNIEKKRRYLIENNEKDKKDQQKKENGHGIRTRPNGEPMIPVVTVIPSPSARR